MSFKFLFLLLLLGNCIASAFSQFLLKRASEKQYDSFVSQYLNVQVIFAYSLFFAVVIVNTYLLRFLPLVIVNPVAESVPVVLSVISGKLFFKENISAVKFVGIFIVLCGVVLMVV